MVVQAECQEGGCWGTGEGLYSRATMAPVSLARHAVSCDWAADTAIRIWGPGTSGLLPKSPSGFHAACRPSVLRRRPSTQSMRLRLHGCGLAPSPHPRRTTGSRSRSALWLSRFSAPRRGKVHNSLPRCLDVHPSTWQKMVGWHWPWPM